MTKNLRGSSLPTSRVRASVDQTDARNVDDQPLDQ